jgi:hypothetical protein
MVESVVFAEGDPSLKKSYEKLIFFQLKSEDKISDWTQEEQNSSRPVEP